MFKIDVEKKLGSLLIKCNFEMESAGITAICGSSGAGKTSVINMTAGLITPDKGIISYNGKEFYNSEKHINLPANKRFTGYVFQESRLFPNMSVKKNLLYGADRKSNNSLNCSLDEVCGLLGITHLLDRYPQNLSGGEKQRVAIGRALLSNPEILLMDEPLASLDDSRKSELISYINIIQKHYNIPILYVSHSIDEILQLSDNALFMEQGISKYFGRTVEVLKQPLHDPIPVEKQVLILYALTHGYLDAVPVEDIGRFQNELFDNFDSSHADLLKTIRETGELPDDKKLSAAVEEFSESFTPSEK